jgi:hypothetical protein
MGLNMNLPELPTTPVEVIREKQDHGKMYLHHRLTKDGYYRTALCEIDSKKVGDVIIINDEKWTISEIASGPIIGEDTFKDVLNYNDECFFTEPRMIAKIIYNKKIFDDKLFHEFFEYDNGFIIDTWIETGEKSHKYIADLQCEKKRFKKTIEVEVEGQIKRDSINPRQAIRDEWDIGALFVKAEDIMTEILK